MFDVIIIGAGIIGLATGVKILQKNPGAKLLILEKESQVAVHQTGHNSGVIHSGIYYRPGSLKARNCRAGVRELIAFCDTHEIPYELCGKVIVATDETELPRLANLLERGLANGVRGLEIIGTERLREIEPHARGIKAIIVPETGIINFTEVARTCAKIIERKGGTFLFNTEVIDLVETSDRCIVETTAGEYGTTRAVNCAGLYSDRIAAMSGKEPPIRIIPFRGEYYTLRPESRSLVKNLIYPVPDPRFPFLGVHFTRRLDGKVEAGPNAVLAFAREGYKKTDFDLTDMWSTLSYPGFLKMAREYWSVGIGEYWRSMIKKAFVKALQKLMPDITDEDLAPGGSGVRAQAVDRRGKLCDDFYFQRTERVLHVLNAPSPAATASFAIADRIVAMLNDDEERGTGIR